MALLALFAILALPALTLPAASATPASTTGRAAVEIVQISPLMVAGRGFKPKERIRVTANGRRKLVSADRRGRFDVAFPEANACNGVFVVALGSKGSRASVTFAQFSDILCLEP
jgi:hypothetical protein